MSSRTRLFIVLVSAPVLAIVLLGGAMSRSFAAGNETYRHLRVFEDVMSLIVNAYVEPVGPDRVMPGAMQGLVEALDPDSAWLTPAQVRDVERGAKVGPAGVGLELTRQYYLRVIAARQGSPAARAGLRSGDYIRAINGKPTRSMSVYEGTRLLRGEAGTEIGLTVLRGNATEPHDVTLTRELPVLPPVTHKMLAGQVGYIRIPVFTDRVAADVRNTAAALRKAGASGLIVDVRGTAEGAYDQGLAAAQVFVSQGTLAVKENRQTGRTTIPAEPTDSAVKLPVTVLVDSGTSGPAELFAAALDGNDRAELVGEQTIGRASQQQLVKLPDGSGLWLSTSQFLTPTGEAITDKGLKPDVVVEGPEVEFGAAAPTTDPILEKALERLAVKAAA